MDPGDRSWIPPTESVTLTSVGIDIGSATSQVAFSRIILDRQGRQLSSRFVVVERTVLAASEVWFTPYSDPDTIDADRLAALVASSYEAAGIEPGGVDTGAVIITGEAARKDNAERIVSALAAHAGEFVSATAGPVLEGILAAHGSGAVQRSTEGEPVLNVDIGGGTTKVGLVRGGRVDHVHAVNVGGRLIAWDPDGIVVRLERAGAALARAAGVEIAVGRPIAPEQAAAIGRIGADVIAAAMSGCAGPHADLARALAITGPLPEPATRRVVFSGGVGRLVDERVPDAYGDLGHHLAAAIADGIAGAGWQVVPAHETLRATVVGVGQFTVQLSGSTISVSPPDVGALRNVQVVAVPAGAGTDPAKIAAEIGSGLERAGRDDGDGPIAVALTLPHPESPRTITDVARGVLTALPATVERGHALVVVVDKDIAGVLGHLMCAEEEFSGPLIVLDQIEVEELEFLDIGRRHETSGAVPVVVKSLVF